MPVPVGRVRQRRPSRAGAARPRGAQPSVPSSPAPPRAPRAPHLRPSGPTAHGPGRGAGPRTRGVRAALPPRPPAAGPQPWTRHGGAAPARRASRGPWRRVRKHRALHASALGPRREAAAAAATSADSTCSPRGSGLARAGFPASSRRTSGLLLPAFSLPLASPFLLPFPAPQLEPRWGGLWPGLASSGRGYRRWGRPAATRWNRPPDQNKRVQNK